jgi:hypothetical protein
MIRATVGTEIPDGVGLSLDQVAFFRLNTTGEQRTDMLSAQNAFSPNGFERQRTLLKFCGMHHPFETRQRLFVRQIESSMLEKIGEYARERDVIYVILFPIEFFWVIAVVPQEGADPLRYDSTIGRTQIPMWINN